MKIAAFNHGGSGIELASSRLRSMYVFQSSVWKDHEVEFNPKFSSINGFQCIHLQQVFKPRYILLVIYARIMGKLVIYDIVDQAYQIKHLIALFMMVFFSNAVVVDTNLRKNYLYKGSRKKNIFVIPDALDLIPFRRKQFLQSLAPLDIENKNVLPSSIRNLSAYGKSIIIWVGHLDNFSSFQILIDADDRLFKYEIIVITDISFPSKVKLNHPNYTIKQWHLNWKADLKTSNKYYMLLNHNDKNSIYKSENKMVTAIYNFIIPIVSDTPSYSSLAKKLDAEFLVFKKNQYPFDLINNLDKKENEWLNSFFTHSKVYIDNNYSNDVVGAKLLNLFEA